MPDSSPTDAQLVSEALADPESYGVIIELYESPLRRYIHRITEVDDSEADDILQDVFLKAWRGLRGYDSALSLRSWLYRITQTTVVSRYRSLKVRALGNSTELTPELAEVLPGQTDILAHTDQSLLSDEINRALTNLSPKEQQLITLLALEELSYTEVSDVLQISMGSVASGYARAKAKLRTHLSHLSPTI